MRTHVSFTPAEQPAATVGIVVDVLRATSTMTQALASGYERVLCCAEIEEARALADAEGPAKLAGERRLEHIEGFDFGNSPRELEGEPAAETLILTTTNGTRLLVAAAEGLGVSRSAANLRRHGMEADVDVCARESVLDVVPHYAGRVGTAAAPVVRRTRNVPVWGGTPSGPRRRRHGARPSREARGIGRCGGHARRPSAGSARRPRP